MPVACCAVNRMGETFQNIFASSSLTLFLLILAAVGASGIVISPPLTPCDWTASSHAPLLDTSLETSHISVIVCLYRSVRKCRRPDG